MKGKKTDLSGTYCAIARALGLIGDWWSLLIIRDAVRGSQRFSEFEAGLGLAKNILSVRLRKLVNAGIMKPVPDQKVSGRNVYVLTERGESLGVVLVALWQWGEENCFEPGELDRMIVDTESGEPLAQLSLITQTGRKIRPSNFTTASKSMKHACVQKSTMRPHGSKARKSAS